MFMRKIILLIVCGMIVGCSTPTSHKIAGVHKGIVQTSRSERNSNPPYLVTIRTWDGKLVTDTLGAYEYFKIGLGDTIK